MGYHNFLLLIVQLRRYGFGMMVVMVVVGSVIAAMRNGSLEARFAEIPPNALRESVISSFVK